MLHIATVHWQNPTWIELQARFFSHFLKDTEYLLYGCLNGFDPEPYQSFFHYVNTEPIVAHTTKLNLLADIICKQGSDDDLIIFIDGDALPVQNFVPFVSEQLQQYPLVAVQRLENEGDPQPHPCFCVTTIKFWKEIEGDWNKGPKWTTNAGTLRSDTGGVLWDRLRRRNIDWKPILRSNTVNLHPLWFAVYGDLVYHHGAAFRTPYCRVDIEAARKVFWKRCVLNIADLPAVSRLRGGWVQNAAYSFVLKESILKTLSDSDELLEEMKQDYTFYRRLVS